MALIFIIVIFFACVESENCRRAYYKFYPRGISVVKAKGVELAFQSINKTETARCAINMTELCKIIIRVNFTGYENLYITCRTPGYRVYVTGKPLTSSDCQGLTVFQLWMTNCTVDWEVVDQLAYFANPKFIDLVDTLMLSSENNTDTPVNTSYRHRCMSIAFLSKTNYPHGLTTAGHLATHLYGRDAFKSYCVRCQMKTYKSQREYLHMLQNFPGSRFPNILEVHISDINISGVSDFTSYGEIQVLNVINSGLEAIPNWHIAKTRVLREVVLGIYGEVQRSIEHVFQRGRVNAPGSPLLDSDYPLGYSECAKLQKKDVFNVVNLSFNSLRRIDQIEGMDKLDTVIITNNLLHGSSISNISSASNLCHLDLSYNQLDYLPETLFADWTHLEYLVLKECNLQSFDSLLKADIRSVKALDVYNNRFNHVPSELFQVPDLLSFDVSFNTLSDIEFHTNGTRSKLMFINLVNTTQTVFPAVLLTNSFPNMGEILIWGNTLSSASMRTMVNMDKNVIRYGRRGVVQLMYNCIEYIPLTGRREVETLNRVLEVFTLYLHNNPLHCGCEEMVAWLQSKGVENTFAIKCSPTSSFLSGSFGKTLFTSFPKSRCDTIIGGPYPYKCLAEIKAEANIKIAISLVFSVFILISLCIIIKANALYIRMWIYVLTGHRLCPRRRDQGEFKYDAFVCYSSEDYRWVLQTLRPELEEVCHPPYSLCLNDRDFIPGMDIAENVMNAMEASRAVILVMSPHSAQSEWCGFEINAAIEERVLGERQLTLIPVILDHVNLQQFTRRQRRTLKKIPFLLADEVRFFTKMKFLLGTPMDDKLCRPLGLGQYGEARLEIELQNI